MDKQTKAIMYLKSVGCEAMKINNKVSVLLHNENPDTRYWMYVDDAEVNFYSKKYDTEHGGYATLKEVLAWADKQPEYDIIDLSFEELIKQYERTQSMKS